MAVTRPGRKGRAAALAALLSVVTGLSAALPAQAAPAAEAGPLRVAVVVPITAPLDAPALIGADSLAEWTAPGGLLDARLEAVAGTAATLAVDPRIPASIRLLGSDAPASATAWLARLEGLANDSFALAYADADAAGLADADRLDLAAPLDLSFAVDPGRFDEPAPTTAPGTTPAPSPEPTGPALPTDEELLAVRATLPGVLWAAPGALGPDGLAALGEAGTGLLLLPSGELSRGGHVRVGGLSALGVDEELSLLADQAAAAAAAGPAARAALTAALLGRDPAAGPVVIGLSRAGAEAPGLGALLATLAGGRDLLLTGLGALAEGSPDAASLRGEPDPGRARLIARIAAAADAAVPLSTVVADPGALLAEQRLELLTALASGRVGAPPAVEEAFLAAAEALPDAVQLADSSDLLVLSNSTGLPVTVSNALDVPATVFVSARPLRPLLRIQGVPLEVTLEPGSSRTVYLPAQAVTNGRVQVLLSLTSPSGARIGPERSLNVDLQAQWEAVGIAVLAVLVVAFAAGIANNIVRRRRAARSRAASESAEAPEVPSDGGD